MPRRTRNFLYWFAILVWLAFTAWELHLGNTLFYQ